jgi:hypothetical protein
VTWYGFALALPAPEGGRRNANVVGHELHRTIGITGSENRLVEKVMTEKQQGIQEAIQWLRLRGMPIQADKMERKAIDKE